MDISYHMALELYGHKFNVIVKELTLGQQKEIREKADQYIKLSREANTIAEKILLKREKFELLKSSDLKDKALEVIEEIEALEDELRNPKFDTKKVKDDLNELALQKIKDVICGEDGQKLIEFAETYGKQEEIFEKIAEEIKKEKEKK